MSSTVQLSVLCRPGANKKAAKGSSGRAVAESEWGQAMDVWLNLVHDYEELEKEKKAKAASEKRQKGHVVMLRERMNQTIRDRRAAELEEGLSSAVDDSSQSPEQPQPTPPAIKNRRSGNHSVNDKAFASQRRTVDRVLDTLTAGDEAMVMQVKEVERDKMDRWEAVERDKLDVLRQAFGTREAVKGASSSAEVERLAVQVKVLEAQAEEMQRMIAAQGEEMQRAIAAQGEEMQRAFLNQGQRTDEKLSALMAMFQQPR